MTGTEIGAILFGAAALTTSFGTLLVSIRSLMSVKSLHHDVNGLHHDVNGRLSQMIKMQQAKNVLDKSKSYMQGAKAQRNAKRGMVVTTAPEKPTYVPSVAPKRPRHQPASRNPPK